MINDHLGSWKVVDGIKCFVSHPGTNGFLMFGPYDWLAPGRYRAEFDLALLTAPGDPEQPSARIDAATSYGDVILAMRSVLAVDLADSLRTFAIEFDLHDHRQLEYRVHAPANGVIAAAPARLIKLDEAANQETIDIAAVSADPFLLAQQVRAILRLLQPARAVGFDKVRLGNFADGGYVCLDDFAGIDISLSFGISDDITWDLDAAERGLIIYQFDHTVEDPAPDDTRLIFEKKMIAPDRGEGRETIADLVRRHDRGNARPNIFLKMDIENAEWAAILATEATELGRFSQIVCELHNFGGLADPEVRKTIDGALRKLNESYAVVHVHANNYAGWVNIANVMVPGVLEITYANRAIYNLVDTNEMFPTPLDMSCDRTRPDMYLGNFRF